uniref:Uncharacterized protein n=1 Tax=Glossina palpalis gambiensis TaxID=67801 RepID=A0A1B0B324_9MUSC
EDNCNRTIYLNLSLINLLFDKTTITELFLPNCSGLCLVGITAAQAVLSTTPRLCIGCQFTIRTTSLNSFKYSILQGLLKVNTIFPFIRSWMPANAVIDNRTDERKEKNTGNKASRAFERIAKAQQLRRLIDEFHKNGPENSSITAPKGGIMGKMMRKLRDDIKE